MKKQFLLICLLVSSSVFAQLEISGGFVINKNEAVGYPIQIGNDFKLKDRFYTKSKLGYKHLSHYNDYVGANLKISIWEIHQTFSYEVVKTKKYTLKPNVGVNYRFYHWKGEMDPPFNTLPERAWVLGIRDGRFILNSFEGGQNKEYRVNNFGFSFQLQNQFKLTEKVWLHITSFIEPDYDKIQNSGGVYIGAIFKSI